MIQRTAILLLLLGGIWPIPGGAQPADPAELCMRAATTAAAESGVPRPILNAILLAESGRSAGQAGLRPWPWTLHANGRGAWFETADEARGELARLVATGTTNIDIGCFQINLRWHGAAYTAPEALFDPLTNARHAAAFLADLHRDSADWRVAAGRYHSRDAARAEAYVARLEVLHAKGATPHRPDAPETTARHDITGLTAAPMSRADGRPLIDLGRRVTPLVGGAP